MDSFRLKINNNDLSTATIEQTTNICGYTVVKAEKGSVKPIRVPANSASKIQDLFGKVSIDYPELYEAVTFNSEYDLYISAPCKYGNVEDKTGTKVPAACITGNGIFSVAEPIYYTKNVEELIEGSNPDLDEKAIPGFENENIDVLMDSRYPKTNGFGAASDIDAKNSPTTLDQSLIIKTGLTWKQLKNAVGGSDFNIKLKYLPAALGATLGKEYKKTFIDVKAVFDTSSNFLSLKQAKYHYIDASQSATEIKTGTDIEIGEAGYLEDGAWVHAIVDDKENLCFRLNGATIPAAVSSKNDLFSVDYVKNILLDNHSTLAFCYVVPYKVEDIFGVIFPKYPSERALHIGFDAFNENKGYSAKTVASRNIIKMSSIYEEGAFHDASHVVSITGSLSETVKSINGSYIGFNENNADYVNQNLVSVYTIKPFTSVDQFNVNITKYPTIILCDGVRVDGEHNDGWDYAKNEEYADVDIFFDSEMHEITVPNQNPIAIDNKFYTLAERHKLAGYIYNCTIAPELILNTDGSQKQTTPLTFGHNYWNINNAGVVVLADTGAKFLSPMTGSRALMQCRIIENRWGGLAPMYLNQSNPSMGGQLYAPYVTKLRYRYSKEEQEALDNLNFNPIINDRVYGIMVVGQKTSKEGATTDWSYIGHVSSFLVFQKEVRTNVMIPQLGKANNPYYRELRAEQVQQMLTARTTGNNRIWAEAIVDTSTADGVNDLAAQRARKFIIDVKVKVDTFSEYVILNFTNVDADTSLISAV